MTDPLAAIKALTGAAASQPPASYWECQGCGKTGTGPFPAVCECGARCWPGTTPEEAHTRVMRVKGVQPLAPQPPAPQPPAPQPPAPPAPEKPEPAKRGRKPKAQAADTPAATDQPQVNQPPANVAPLTADQYEMARQQFALQHGLNQVEWKRVGEARVVTIGFTVWKEMEDGRRLPVYFFMEPSDTPESFRATFDRIKQAHPMARMDVFLCSQVRPAGLKVITYQGELTAQRNAGDGPLDAKRGDTVIIGARLSQSGSIIYAAIERKETV